jgi:predicted RNase H-like nuclease
MRPGVSFVMGIDAMRTPRGVITVSVLEDHLHEVRLHPTLDEALGAAADVDMALIDLPIGHDDPEGRMREGRRSADLAAREFVGRRVSEVPWVTPFIVFHAASLEAACKEAESQGWPAPTKAQWSIRDRILRLQRIVQHHPGLHEGHPAVSFQSLHVEACGEGHLAHPSHYWSGLHERLTLLHHAGLRPTRSFGGIGKMDPAHVVDATVLAWSARRLLEGKARIFPEGAAPDAVRIVA